MANSIQAVLITPDLPRLQSFYVDLVGADPGFRMPADGPVFYQALSIGTGELGLVADTEAQLGTPSRFLISIDVDDVDQALGRVESLGGTAGRAATDMPWGQRVAHIQDPDGNAVNLTQAI